MTRIEEIDISLKASSDFAVAYHEMRRLAIKLLEVDETIVRRAAQAEETRDAAQAEATRNTLARRAAEAERTSWKDAVIDALVVNCIYLAVHELDPKRAINDLICWENKIALDPQVSGEANRLIQAAFKAGWESRTEQLTVQSWDEGFKDWENGGYLPSTDRE